MKHGRFLIKHGRFRIKLVRFLIKCRHLFSTRWNLVAVARLGASALALGTACAVWGGGR